MNWCPDKYTKAWHFATSAHEGQTYGSPEKGKRIAYINHIGNVVAEVMWALQDRDEYNCDLAIQCALLHDVIEDTDKTYKDVMKHFGSEIANGVLALTKNEKLETKKAQMRDSLNRILKESCEVWIVKMADRISNLQYPPHHWKEEKITYYKEEAIFIHGVLKESNSILAKRLLAKIQKYHTL